MNVLIKSKSIWQELEEHASLCLQELDLRQELKDPARFEKFSLQAPHVLVDFSKNLWNEPVLSRLVALADLSGLASRRDTLLQGSVVNVTEQRPALHACLRALNEHTVLQAGNSVHEDCQKGVWQMLELAEQVRSNSQIHDVVHIGIGGSGLGPELVLQALHPWCDAQQRVHVVSNMDGHDLQQVLQKLQPAHTIFVVASKSWSTAETLRNMSSAREWSRAALGERWCERFIAVTSREEAARKDGFARTLHIPEGIGGRFSVWSAVGLPIAIAMGRHHFLDFLRGAADMDTHFAQAPLVRNVPVWLGLLDLWCSSFLKIPGRCVAPYHHGLRRLPAYLQQLEMESNGKSVQVDGSPVSCPTTGMVWGEAGSNGQHAFFQWLHQGTQRIPVEFIVARKASHGLPEHQEALMANALAQSQALMAGGQAAPGQLPGHQDFPGNRPSTFMVLDALTPASLGALLALHEHRVFVAGVLWGINSFDQWGVELGKTLARDLRERMNTRDYKGLDASTAGLLSYCLSAD